MDYIVSFRKKFDSKFSFASEPEVITAGTGEVLSVDHLAEAVRDKKCLFLIHGYSNSATDAISAYNVVSSNLKTNTILYDVIIGLLWPGHTGAGFWLAVPSANKSGIELADLLLRLKPSSVDIEAHSLGNRVMFECMDNIYPVSFPIKNLISLAAAIDDESLQEGQKYFNATKKCDKVFIGYSKRDEVLGVWYRKFGSLPWNLATGGDTALGFYGPTDPTKCFKTITMYDGTEYVSSHSAWKTVPQVYAQWKKLVT